MSELTDRLVEAAARQIALAANEGEDWPVRDEDRHDARMVLRAVLPMLADEIEALAPVEVFTPYGAARQETARRAAALIREAQP